jgi:hypothetical protein
VNRRLQKYLNEEYNYTMKLGEKFFDGLTKAVNHLSEIELILGHLPGNMSQTLVKTYNLEKEYNDIGKMLYKLNKIRESIFKKVDYNKFAEIVKEK